LAALAIVPLLGGGARAADDPSSCPASGFERAECLLTIARGRPRCGPARFEATVARRIARLAKLVGLAETLRTLGRAGPARTALRRAARTIVGSQVKTLRLAANPLTAPCVAPLDAVLASLWLTVDELRFGPPPFDPPSPSPSPTVTTTTTSSLPPTTGRPPTTSTPTTSAPTTLPPRTCGNGRLDPGEQCDGQNLFGRDCKTLGFIGGTLRCDADCIFDNRDCHQ
jgi:hypothetical protein